METEVVTVRSYERDQFWSSSIKNNSYVRQISYRISLLIIGYIHTAHRIQIGGSPEHTVSLVKICYLLFDSVFGMEQKEISETFL
jgi:hypothetical protein